MKTVVITGGSSGIGLEAGRQLVALGHQVLLLGRDPKKGEDAAKALGANAAFLASDLSSHAGVKAAADAIAAKHPQVDALIHSAGHLTIREQRTADDLHPVFAVNYLSRYHLTQRLLPCLRKSEKAKVVLIVAGVPLDTTIDFSQFPAFKPFPGMGALSKIQIANFHYVAHLSKNEKGISSACTNVGLVKTEIMRDMPALMRAMFTVFSPVFTIPVARAAANPVHLVTHDDWASGGYWAKPGRIDQVTPISLDPDETQKVVAVSRELTGA